MKKINSRLMPLFVVCLFTFSFLHAKTSRSAINTSSPDDIITSIDLAVQKRISNQATINDLAAVLRNPDMSIQARERAAWALGKLEARTAANVLIEAARHRGLLIRSAALGALTQLRARGGLSVYKEIAESDPVLQLRQRATIALGLLRWEKTIPTLVKLASDPSAEVRGASVLAMAATHSKKNDFSDALKDMAGDENPYVRERAEKSLEIIQRKNAAIYNQLKSNDADIRLFAALYFHHNGRAKDLPVVRDAQNTESDEDVRQELAWAALAIKKRIAAEEAKKKKARQAAESAKKKPAEEKK